MYLEGEKEKNEKKRVIRLIRKKERKKERKKNWDNTQGICIYGDRNIMTDFIFVKTLEKRIFLSCFTPNTFPRDPISKTKLRLVNNLFCSEASGNLFSFLTIQNGFA